MIIKFFLRTFLRKEVATMAVIYATLIVKGKKRFTDVPVVLKEQVKQILNDLEIPELAEEGLNTLLLLCQKGGY